MPFAAAFGPFSAEAFALASAYQPELQLLGPILAQYPSIEPVVAPILDPVITSLGTLLTKGLDLVGPLYGPYRTQFLEAETKLAAALAPYAQALAHNELGGCIVESLRSGDAAARFGGEEFAAFLLECELPQALVAAERIRSRVDKETFSVIRRGKRAETHHVTISIGIATYPDDSSDPIELVEMADSALYRAKREGRNRVCAYRDLSPDEMNRELPPRRD